MGDGWDLRVPVHLTELIFGNFFYKRFWVYNCLVDATWQTFPLLRRCCLTSSIWDAVNLECNFPKHLGTQVPTQASAPTELFLPEMRLCPLSAILSTFFIQLKMVLPYLRSLFIYASPNEPFICSVWHLPMLPPALLLHLHLCFFLFFLFLPTGKNIYTLNISLTFITELDCCFGGSPQIFMVKNCQCVGFF